MIQGNFGHLIILLKKIIMIKQLQDKQTLSFQKGYQTPNLECVIFRQFERKVWEIKFFKSRNFRDT